MVLLLKANFNNRISMYYNVLLLYDNRMTTAFAIVLGCLSVNVFHGFIVKNQLKQSYFHVLQLLINWIK